MQAQFERQKQSSEVFCKKGVLRIFAKFTGKHLCQSLFFNNVAGNFIKKETLAQVFFCEFCENSKNTFSFLRWLLLERPCNKMKNITSEAVVRRCFVKKVFLETSQNSHKNTCARVSF